MTVFVRSSLAAVVAGTGLVVGSAAAGDCPPGQYCPDKKVYPRLEHFYIKKFCGPVVSPNACFGYFKPKVTPWELACPGACDPYESVYPSNGPVPPNAVQEPETPAKQAEPKEAEPAKPAAEKPAPVMPTKPPVSDKPPVEPAPLPKPPTVPLIDPKKDKDGGKSSRLDAPRIVLPPAPTTPVTTTVRTGEVPPLLPPVVSR